MFDGSLVSAIIPAHRAADTLGETLISIRKQSWRAWEALVIDDGSPDDTVAVAEAHAREDPRIKVLRHERNQGVAAARSTGLAAARGRYVAFLDADDLWLPSKLEIQLASLQVSESILAFTSFRRFSTCPTNAGPAIPVPDRIDYRQLLVTNHVATSTVMVDRARCGDFRMRQAFHDDYATWLWLLKQGGHGIGVQQDLMRYRVRPGSLSYSKLKSARHTWDIYRKVEEFGPVKSAAYFTMYAVLGAWKHFRSPTGNGVA